jgi:hypothetical protein
MEDNYYINLNNYSLSSYAKELEHAELLPSRKIIQENTKERFSRLNKEGIKNLNDVITVLKSKDQVKAFAKKSGIPEEFLIILVREIKSFQPKPVKLNDLPAISKTTIKKLETTGIKNTKELFKFVTTEKNRQELSSKTGINSKEIIELTKLTDVSRIKWVGANFARVLVDSNYDTVKKVAKADYKKLRSCVFLLQNQFQMQLNIKIVPFKKNAPENYSRGRCAFVASSSPSYNKRIYGSGLGSPLSQIFLPLRSRKTSYIPNVIRNRLRDTKIIFKNTKQL